MSESCGEVREGGRWVRWSVVCVVVLSFQPSIISADAATLAASAVSVLKKITTINISQRNRFNNSRVTTH